MNPLCNTFSYIYDYKRTNSYNRFLKENAKDKIVIDCGAGSGVLSDLAEIHGAKEVYSLEKNKETLEYLRTRRNNVLDFDLLCDTFPKGDIYVHELFETDILGDGLHVFLENCLRQNIRNVFPNYIKLFIFDEWQEFEEIPLDGNIKLDKEIPRIYPLELRFLRSYKSDIVVPEVFWEGNIFDIPVEKIPPYKYISWAASFDGKHEFSTINKHYNNWILFTNTEYTLNSYKKLKKSS